MFRPRRARLQTPENRRALPSRGGHTQSVLEDLRRKTHARQDSPPNTHTKPYGSFCTHRKSLLLTAGDDIHELTVMRLQASKLNREKIENFVHGELRLKKTIDGYDAPASEAGRCENIWALYRAMRTLPRRSRGEYLEPSGQRESELKPCTFGESP